MLSRRPSKLREWGLFVLVALLPAVAIGAVGLRALRNEEAAVRREMRLVLERTADEASTEFQTTLSRMAGGDLDTDAPFLERVSFPTQAAAPPAASARGAASAHADEADCGKLARDLRSANGDGANGDGANGDGANGDGANGDGAAAREHILDRCAEARTAAGKLLWPIVALSDQTRTDAGRIERWLREHAGKLTPPERAAAHADIEAASWLSDDDRRLLVELLEPKHAEATSTLLASQRQAMRSGRPRIEWSDEHSRGLLLRQADGGYVGYIIHPGILARALRSGWPERGDDVKAELVVGRRSPDMQASFEVLVGGAHVVLEYKNPLALAERTERSKRLLAAIAAVAGALAIALGAYLFARVRAERRLGALRTDFVAAVSHELRTPIASIRMLSELLAAGDVEDADERAEMHQALAREAKRLGDTVNRLLGFSRMEAGKHTTKATRMNVSEAVEDSARTIEDRHPSAGPIERQLPEVMANVDGEALKMAVTNLLENAVKYAKPPYAVSVEAQGGGVRIAVRDHGPGLSKRDQRRIFRPFERVDDRLSEATEGSGIGLSLVSHVARSHRGRAGVESQLGSGSTFFLWLPAGDQEKEPHRAKGPQR